eukprot:TRINITY_DN30397_c0_g1_i1.p1 TRINITY_DN30397_c0_g1~~TRINITY_DN30397_c0_g1_i1.p1  ORF type:complete len:243 (+),score=93.80 TRINITY_DN30397_c0_g1_i1:45-731(+)
MPDGDGRPPRPARRAPRPKQPPPEKPNEVSLWVLMNWKWKRFLNIPTSMVIIVCLVWILISAVFAADGYFYYLETRDKWTDKTTCTVIEMERAVECIEGPGAGGMGFRYVAKAEICQDVRLHSEAQCGLLNLAGEKWFLHVNEKEKVMADSSLNLKTTECYVAADCTGFDFASVVNSKKRRSTVMLYTAALVLLPLGVLITVLFFFFLFRLCFRAPDLDKILRTKHLI